MSVQGTKEVESDVRQKGFTRRN